LNSILELEISTLQLYFLQLKLELSILQFYVGSKEYSFCWGWRRRCVHGGLWTL